MCQNIATSSTFPKNMLFYVSITSLDHRGKFLCISEFLFVNLVVKYAFISNFEDVSFYSGLLDFYNTGQK